MSEAFPALNGLQVGSLLAGYRLEAQVGAGGMAVVFRARDQRLGRLVALKVLTPTLTADSLFRRRFIAESRAAAAVDDPHIIPVHEAGEANGVLFIAMRLVTGGDLRRVLEQEGALPPGRAAEFISPVASALDAAHRAGLVHRDVKPANILVDVGPNRPDHVYLSDFGVSKGAVSSVSLTGTGQFLGTPQYSPPEQIQGREVDGRTDQYALACVAYQLLTGEVAFERDQGMAVMLAHLSEPPPSLAERRPDLPPAADKVLVRGMAKVPEKRYGSCGDFADALREALGLAPYHHRGPASGPEEAAVPAGLAATATPSATATVVPPVTETASSPANSAAGQTEEVAKRDAERQAREDLATHYALACAAAEARDWDQVLVLFTMIADVDPGYRDVHERIENARYQQITRQKAEEQARREAYESAAGQKAQEHALVRHALAVTSVAFSPDGRLLATASADRTARLWNPATGECRRTLTGHTGTVWAVAFSPDDLLATASDDQTARLWNPATGECRRTLTGHTSTVIGVAFSPDGRLLATASADRTARLWNPATRTRRRTLRGLTDHALAVNGVAFSPDGRLLATASADRTARLWNPATGECRRTLTGHTGTVWAVAFSPDGRLLATASADRTARLWNPATGECRRTLTGHTGTVRAVAFSPDGRLLATASDDHTARLWD